MGLNLQLFNFLSIEYEIRVADSGMGKNPDPVPVSGMGNIRISIRDKHPGSVTLVSIYLSYIRMQTGIQAA